MPFETSLFQRAYLTRYHLNLSLILFCNGNDPAHPTEHFGCAAPKLPSHKFPRKTFQPVDLPLWQFFYGTPLFPCIYAVKLNLIVQQKSFQCQAVLNVILLFFIHQYSFPRHKCRSIILWETCTHLIRYHL